MAVAAAITSAALSLGGAGVSFAQQGRQGREARRESEQEARLVETAAQQRASALQQDAGRLAASQRAAFGAAGVGTQSQTAAQVILETFAQSTLEQQRILSGASAQAERLRKRARNIKRATQLGQISTLLGGAGQALGGLQQSGLLDPQKTAGQSVQQIDQGFSQAVQSVP